MTIFWVKILSTFASLERTACFRIITKKLKIKRRQELYILRTTDFQPIVSIVADWLMNPGNPHPCCFVYIPIIPLLVADSAIKNVKRQLLKQLDLLLIKWTMLKLAKSWSLSNFCYCLIFTWPNCTKISLGVDINFFS